MFYYHPKLLYSVFIFITSNLFCHFRRPRCSWFSARLASWAASTFIWVNSFIRVYISLSPESPLFCFTLITSNLSFSSYSADCIVLAVAGSSRLCHARGLPALFLTLQIIRRTIAPTRTVAGLFCRTTVSAGKAPRVSGDKSAAEPTPLRTLLRASRLLSPRLHSLLSVKSYYLVSGGFMG